MVIEAKRTAAYAPRMHLKKRLAYGAALIAILLLGTAPATAAPPSNAARTAAVLDRIAASPLRLRVFLQAMPKGGDLHNHSGGAIYAEDFLRWAAADGLCLDTDDYSIVDPPCDARGRMPAAGLDYADYSRAIDRISTRGFESGVIKHKQSRF